MFKSWQVLFVLAFVLVLIYVGFDLYNSYTGDNVEFNKEITPIENDFRLNILDHIGNAEESLPYTLEERAEDEARIEQRAEDLLNREIVPDQDSTDQQEEPLNTN